ncbi:MAG: AbrB/MazE/SpoVT family DNA-binding domain-containing protein [Thermoplasmatota archaeon]
MEEENSELLMLEREFKVQERSRSIQITIPKKAARMLNISDGDHVKYFVHKKGRYLIVVKKDLIRGTKVNLPVVGEAYLEGSLSLVQ